MIENKTIKNGALIKKNVPVYIENELKYGNAIKKENITSIKGVGSQLTLLAKVVEQIGNQVGLDSPEFTELKDLIAQINLELQ